MLKTSGYIISAFSVILLGIVSWQATEDDPVLRLALLAGMLTAILGMFCRWLSYEIEKKKKDRSVADRRAGRAARALSMSVQQEEMTR